MKDNTDMRLTVESWAKIVIKIWKDKINKKKIRDTNELFLSFASTVLCNANGNPERIVFAFKYYGRFSDMGVGKGVTADKQQSMYDAGLTRRKKKAWFAGTYNSQVERLAEILEEKYALKIASSIVNSLDDL